MAKITWKQFQFLASYCFGRQCNDGATLISGSGSILAADNSYQRAIDVFASGLHELTKSGADVDAQFDLISASPTIGTGVFLGNLLLTACNYSMALQSSSWANSYTVADWLADARPLLIDEASGGGGGGFLTAEDVLEAITGAMSQLPLMFVQQSGGLPDSDYD